MRHLLRFHARTRLLLGGLVLLLVVQVPLLACGVVLLASLGLLVLGTRPVLRLLPGFRGTGGAVDVAVIASLADAYLDVTTIAVELPIALKHRFTQPMRAGQGQRREARSSVGPSLQTPRYPGGSGVPPRASTSSGGLTISRRGP